MATETYLGIMIEKLKTWKKLPKYQFERRIDIFLAPFLKDILEEKIKGQVSLIVPEFPIKCSDTNNSRNADYLFTFDSENGEKKWILFELKTDAGSINKEQLNYYKEAQKCGMSNLLKDVKEITKATKKMEKYAALNELLTDVVKEGRSDSVHIVYLGPESGATEIEGLTYISFRDAKKMKMNSYSEEWDLIKTILPD